MLFRSVAGVDVRRKGRLVLATKEHSDLRCQTTEDHVRSIDDVPGLGHITRLGRKRTHYEAFYSVKTVARCGASNGRRVLRRRIRMHRSRGTHNDRQVYRRLRAQVNLSRSAWLSSKEAMAEASTIFTREVSTSGSSPPSGLFPRIAARNGPQLPTLRIRGRVTSAIHLRWSDDTRLMFETSNKFRGSVSRAQSRRGRRVRRLAGREPLRVSVPERGPPRSRRRGAPWPLELRANRGRAFLFPPR